MDERQKQKLLRYVRNIKFWGIFLGNKEAIRARLDDLHLKSNVPSKATYASLLENLIELNGLDTIIDAINNQMKLLFGTEDLERLRNHWLDGRTPDIAYLRRHKLLENGKIFLDVNTQFDYVEGWKAWAGVWFEEIEPWLKEKG